MAIVTDAVISLGLIGNVLNFLVFSRKTFRKKSISIYCRALAIFDSYTLINLIFDTQSQYLNINWSIKYSIACKIFYFVSAGISPISSWILVLFSIDQIISLSSSKRLRFIKNRGVPILLILILVIFHIFIYTFIPVLLEIKNVTVENLNMTIASCSINNLPYSQIFESFYLIESSFLPFLITLFTSSLLLNRIYNAKRKLSSVFNLNPVTKLKSNVKISKRIKFGLDSVTLNGIFIFFTSPLVIYLIFPTGNYLNDIFNEKFISIFFYLNFSIPFAAHFVVNSLFRSNFLSMIGIGTKNKKQK